MKSKYLLLATVLTLAGCSANKQEETTESSFKVAEAKKTEQTQATEEPQQQKEVAEVDEVETAEEEKPLEELSRYEKAVLQLEKTDSVKEDTKVLDEKLNGLIEKIKKENRLDDYDLSDYILEKNMIYDLKNDVLNLGYEVKKYSVTYSDSEDVWQVLLTLESEQEGLEGYYVAHYNTFFNKFLFFYRDVLINIDSLPVGE